ncbi:MAG: IS110 family transposase [Bacteroidales bacterium]|nr:IS110 family transposase [Bacteroidales bacterium]
MLWCRTPVTTRVLVISEIGVDMSVFPTTKPLCSWAGLVPQSNESAKKKKATHAGAYIKLLLVQCALAICKSNRHSEIKSCYLASIALEGCC